MFLGLGEQHIIAISEEFYDWMTMQEDSFTAPETKWRLFLLRTYCSTAIDSTTPDHWIRLGQAFRGKRVVLEDWNLPQKNLAVLIPLWNDLKALLAEAGRRYTEYLHRCDPPAVLFTGCSFTMYAK